MIDFAYPSERFIWATSSILLLMETYHLYSFLLSPLIFYKLFLSSFLNINCTTILDKPLYYSLIRVFSLNFYSNISIIIGYDSTLGMKIQLAWQNNESFRPWNGVHAFAWTAYFIFSLFLYKETKRKEFFFRFFEFSWVWLFPMNLKRPIIL